jgi:hypothetical protein
MGPLKMLLDLGANIIAIDLDRPQIWSRLLSQASGSCGTMTFPTKKDCRNSNMDEMCQFAGCNLLTQTPEILNWLKVKRMWWPKFSRAYLSNLSLPHLRSPCSQGKTLLSVLMRT